MSASRSTDKTNQIDLKQFGLGILWDSLYKLAEYLEDLDEIIWYGNDWLVFLGAEEFLGGKFWSKA